MCVCVIVCLCDCVLVCWCVCECVFVHGSIVCVYKRSVGFLLVTLQHVGCVIVNRMEAHRCTGLALLHTHTRPRC
jgi:hypothetical protein